MPLVWLRCRLCMWMRVYTCIRYHIWREEKIKLNRWWSPSFYFISFVMFISFFLLKKFCSWQTVKYYAYFCSLLFYSFNIPLKLFPLLSLVLVFLWFSISNFHKALYFVYSLYAFIQLNFVKYILVNSLDL